MLEKRDSFSGGDENVQHTDLSVLGFPTLPHQQEHEPAAGKLPVAELDGVESDSWPGFWSAEGSLQH